MTCFYCKGKNVRYVGVFAVNPDDYGHELNLEADVYKCPDCDQEYEINVREIGDPHYRQYPGKIGDDF